MIGRQKEAERLNYLYRDGRAEFVAIYGRRRIGKTYLVDETFKGRITFRHAGLSPVEDNSQGMMKKQLENFYYSLIMQGMGKEKKPSSWLEAFFLLEKYLESHDDGSRQLVFLDELPWMDTPRSGFITALESFWNNWGCHRENLMLVVCGSSSSWILDNLVNAHGGLYNRLTCEMYLRPFNLKECEDFFKENNINFSRYDIVQSYMIFGGVPYYLGYFQRGLSLAQNVDEIIFDDHAPLKNEYDRLFVSAFANPDPIKKIVEALYKRNSGYTRSEIVKITGMKDGGTLSQHLNALLAGDFITKYVPFGKGEKERYMLTDPFCLFYLHFNPQHTKKPHFWQNNLSSQKVVSWSGISFENICFSHIEQIKEALGISGVDTSCSGWICRKDVNSGSGTQVDLLISRSDNILNMCEIKFYSEKMRVDKNYYQTIFHRQNVVSEQVSPKIAVRSTLITTYGLIDNEYSSAFSNVITLDDMFR